MKAVMKKVAALTCAAGMMLGMTACGGSDAAPEGNAAQSGGTTEAGGGESGEIKDVSVMFITLFGTDGVQEVEDAVNAVTVPKYGLRFHLSLTDFGNAQQQTTLVLTGNDVDILQVFAPQKYVNSGQIADLTPVWETASEEIKNLIDPAWIEACRVNGKLYSMPKLVDYGHYNGLVVDEEVGEAYGLTDMQPFSLEEIDEFLAWCKENYPDRYPLVPTQQGIVMADTDWSWDTLGDGIGVLPDCGQSSTTVESLMDNEDYIELARWCRKWYEAGYYTPDIMSTTEVADVAIDNKKACAKIACYGPSAQPGRIRTVAVDHWTNSGNIAAGAYAINANTEDLEAAWLAMEILYTDPEVGTYIYNGIEGRDYVKNEDGTISWPEGLDASTVPYAQAGITWIMPWAANGGLPFQENGPDFFEELIQYDKEGLFSKANGFSFDPTPVVDEYTACSNVYTKYYKTLLSGTVDVDSTLEQAREEFAAAGLDKVIAEKQRQLDAYLAQKE